MSTPIQPLTLLVVVAGCIQREQQAAIVYLLEENRVLKARLRGRELRLTDDERRRLAVKGKALGRKLLAELAGIVTPETPWLGTEGSLRGSGTKAERRKQLGRPRVMAEISERVVGMAKSNPQSGYDDRTHYNSREKHGFELRVPFVGRIRVSAGITGLVEAAGPPFA